MGRGLAKAREIAKSKGIINNDHDLQESARQGKRFMIKHNNKWIHFGLWPYNGYGTFIDHENDSLRGAWRKRHMKILRKGKPAYIDKESPEFYSWNILW